MCKYTYIKWLIPISRFTRNDALRPASALERRLLMKTVTKHTVGHQSQSRFASGPGRTAVDETSDALKGERNALSTTNAKGDNAPGDSVSTHGVKQTSC